MTAEQIAPIVHEAIRGLQTHLGQQTSPPWGQCTWEKKATIDGIELAFIDPSPGASHKKWMEGRIADGWGYGPVKDSVLKTNPMIIPFEDLPSAEIAKDKLVVSIALALKDAK